jgi:winged helix DNA-binding protein
VAAATKGQRRAPEPAAELSWRQVMAWRVRRHHLDRRVPAKRMLEVASELCGLHAQVMSSAELTLWARVEGLQPDAVSRALWKDRTLVKTWAMRGTLHLLPAAEYGTWQAVLDTYRNYEKPAWGKYFRVTPGEVEELLAACREALDGRKLTREELAERVGEITGSAELGEKLRESWGALLKPASFRGVLCFAPSWGQNVRFTRPDRWLGRQAAVPVDEAQGEVTRRFLAAHGPATREELGRWLAFTPAAAGRLLAGLGDEVAPVDVEGAAAWMLASDVKEVAKASPPRSANLLPGFDQYVICSTKHAGDLMPGGAGGPFRDRIHRKQGWVSPVLLVDGRMDGVWRHERRGKRLVVEIEPFVTVPKWARAAAEEEARRLAGFLGGDLSVSWS